MVTVPDAADGWLLHWWCGTDITAGSCFRFTLYQAAIAPRVAFILYVLVYATFHRHPSAAQRRSRSALRVCSAVLVFWGVTTLLAQDDTGGYLPLSTRLLASGVHVLFFAILAVIISTDHSTRSARILGITVLETSHGIDTLNPLPVFYSYLHSFRISIKKYMILCRYINHAHVYIQCYLLCKVDSTRN